MEVDRACIAAVGLLRAGLLLGACVGVVAIAGTVVAVADSPIDLLYLNREQTVAAYMGAWLLFAAGTIAVFIGRKEVDDRMWWLVLGLAIAAIGFDEAAELHERVEVRADVPAAVVVSPIALVAALAWWMVLPRMRQHPPALPLFAAGIVGWAISQSLDPIHSVELKSIVEETLELIGSMLLVLALLAMAREILRVRI